MVSFEQFLGVLRDHLLETKDIEVVLGPHMPTACLVMSHKDWQHFAKAVFEALQLDIDLRVLSGSSTILDLYYASLYRFQLTPILDIGSPHITAEKTNSAAHQIAYLH